MMVMLLGAAANSQTSVSSAASIQGESRAVRVAVFIAPPSVMELNGSLTGFSIDLWNAIATQLKLKTNYQLEPDVGALEEAMRSKKADLSLGLFITSARDAVFDFSIPTIESGLQIIVPSKGSKAHKESPLGDMLRLMFSQTTL